MTEDQIVKALAALGHPLRLKVFRALVVSGSRGLIPGVMQDGLGVPPSTLSFHLKELANAGLVTVERESRTLIYRAEYQNMNGLLGFLNENCCEGASCVVETADAAYKC